MTFRRLAVAAILLCAGEAAAKKAKPPETKWKPPQSSWCIKQGVDEAGDLVFITVDLAYKSFPDKAKFPHLVHINLTIKDQNKNGHPTNDEAEILNRVEDGIMASLFDAEVTPYIGRVTTRGFREVMVYVRDPEKANAVLSRLASSPQLREWEYHVVRDPDPKWTVVQQLFDGEGPCL
jgi:hypothetical protein